MKVVDVQNQPDAFFDEAQQRRLAELMRLWRAARDAGLLLSPAEQSELDQLVEAEIEACPRRAEALLDMTGTGA